MIAHDVSGIASGAASPGAAAAADSPVLRRQVDSMGPPMWRGWSRFAGLALIGIATEPAAYLRLADDGRVTAVSWAIVIGLASMLGAAAVRAMIRRNPARRGGFDPFCAEPGAAPIGAAVAAEPPA
jgi:hypothetical protein